MRTADPGWIKDIEYYCPKCKHRLHIINSKETIDGSMDKYYTVTCSNQNCDFTSRKYHDYKDVEEFLYVWSMREDNNMIAQFGEYERVLVRNNKDEPWIPNLYAYYDYSKHDHVCIGGVHYQDCLLYDKYKELSGTVQDVEYRNISHEEFKKEEDIEYIDFNSKRYRGKFFKQYDPTVAIILDCDNEYRKIPYSNIRKIKSSPEVPKDTTDQRYTADWKDVAYLLAERLQKCSTEPIDKNSSVEEIINLYKNTLETAVNTIESWSKRLSKKS